jgi:hypothetical protein
VRITHLLRIQGLINEAQERATLDAVGAPNVKTLGSKKLDDVGAVLRETQETPPPPTGTSVDVPPFDAAPSDTPAADTPQADQPPTDEPATNERPANEPTTNEPPSNEPPSDEPPSNEP